MRRRLCCALCSIVGIVGASHAFYSTPGKVKVHVTTRDGTVCDFDAPEGVSLMQALRDVAKLDVLGTCDGELECCTCHVYLSKSSFTTAGEPSEDEQDLLDTAPDARANSRLSCQVDLTPELDGIDVGLPSSGGKDPL
jgi:ferredoxin